MENEEGGENHRWTLMNTDWEGPAGWRLWEGIFPQIFADARRWEGEKREEPQMDPAGRGASTDEHRWEWEGPSAFALRDYGATCPAAG